MQQKKFLPSFKDAMLAADYTVLTVDYARIMVKSMLNNAKDTDLFCNDVLAKYLLRYDPQRQRTIITFTRNTFAKFFNYVYFGTITYQRLKKEVPTPQSSSLSKLLDKYLSTLIFNSSNTILKKKKCVASFLIYLEEHGISTIDCLNESIFLDYFNNLSYTDQQRLRMFIIWLYMNEYTKRNFSVLINIRKEQRKLPTVYTEEEIVRMLAAVDGHSKNCVRDKLLLLILVRLGLRSCDVVNLEYSNFDFEQKKLNITQIKTKEPLELAVSDDILDLLNEYMKCYRPQSNTKKIFLNLAAPHRPITTGSLRHMVVKYMNYAGIDISKRKHGTHSMRSSLASAMVNENYSLGVVQKVLGHTSADSIKSYVKVDYQKLRAFSLQVPASSGKFRKWLEGDDQFYE
jgi:site-specific recombinase XerD